MTKGGEENKITEETPFSTDTYFKSSNEKKKEKEHSDSDSEDSVSLPSKTEVNGSLEKIQPYVGIEMPKTPYVIKQSREFDTPQSENEDSSAQEELADVADFDMPDNHLETQTRPRRVSTLKNDPSSDLIDKIATLQQKKTIVDKTTHKQPKTVSFSSCNINVGTLKEKEKTIPQ